MSCDLEVEIAVDSELFATRDSILEVEADVEAEIAVEADTLYSTSDFEALLDTNSDCELDKLTESETITLATPTMPS